MKVKGVVSRVSSRPWKGRNGDVTLYSFQIEGQDTWFRMGESKPDFRETDAVEFDLGAKDKAENIIVTKAAGMVANKQAETSTGGALGSGVQAGNNTASTRDGYWAAKEARDLVKEQRYEAVVEPRITLSSAQSDAITVVGLALQHDLLSFGNANKSAKLGLLLGFVDQVTLRFAKQRMDAASVISGIEPVEVEKVKVDEAVTSFDD
jgi:hypothetical protein